ncbi:CAAX amino protease [Bombiscardovia apis]|uniref:CAAX amino protease n=1 Tax=Bombiscardovia apis TaxID=2932182 RepID=A0ABM8BAY2_9BIFI|nr:Abi family protein [Bombiscardovia apis]BDR54060.1 CAAX amino protease [Bombiscardovia apis]
MLTVSNQIDFLKERNVGFEVIDEEEASKYLTNNTYFFKLKSYLKNYQTDAQNNSKKSEYIESEFAHLQELSKLDYALSRLVLELASNVEHAMKVQFNQHIMNPISDIDVDELANTLLSSKTIRPLQNPYTESLYNSCNPNFHVWELWELLGFNDQINLYSAFQAKADIGDIATRNERNSLLFVTRMIRNAAAHGSCLLANVRQKAPSLANNKGSDHLIMREAMQMCEKKIYQKNRAKNLQIQLDTLIVHNFAAVLVSHLQFVQSQAVIEYGSTKVDTFITRVQKHQQGYYGHSGNHHITRNKHINNTLNAIIELCQGYKQQAAKYSQIPSIR